jgi:type I restriction enzyme R subunit
MTPSGYLDKYADTGSLDPQDPEILRLDPISQFGMPLQIVKAFGGKPAFDAALHTLNEELHRSA